MKSAKAIGLSPYGERIGEINYIELQWNRKWQEPGTFSVYMAAKDWNRATKYVQLAGRPETGVVQRIEYNEKVEGDFITLSGFFIEALLNWKGSLFEVSISNRVNLESYIARMASPTATQAASNYESPGVVFYSIDLTDFANMPSAAESPTTINAGLGIADGIYSALSGAWNSKYGFYSEPIFSENHSDNEPWLGHKIKVLSARDLTGAVKFKKSNDNTSNIEYVRDESAVRNCIRAYFDSEVDGNSWWSSSGKYWAGAGEQGQNRFERRTVHVVQSDAMNNNSISDMGEMYPEIPFSASVETEVASANRVAIANEMDDRGRLEMLNHYKEESLTVEAIQIPGCEYLTDYNIGDLVTCEIDKLQVAYEERIVEVNEVHAANRVQVTMTLGNARKRKWRNI